MVPSSPLHANQDNAIVASQLSQPAHPLMNSAQSAANQGHLEPAVGFSLLHTIQLPTATSVQEVQSASAPTAHPLQGHTAPAQPVAALPTEPPQAAASMPERRRRPPARTPHIVQHCDPQLRRELGAITYRVFDIIAGRRRIDDLRHVESDPIIRAALLTMAKSSSLKGIAPQSFHPSPSADDAKVEFIGSCRTGHRVRAFAGTFRRGNKKTQPWILAAFRVI